MIDEPADVHPFLMYLAYKYVGLAVLLVEASFNAERLNLPIERPILNRQLTNKFIDDPKTPGGRIDVGVYSFAEEGGSTPYHVIVRLEDGSIIPYSRLPPDERNEKLSHEKSLIDTNGAYQLAVAWLKAIDVDVEELGRTNRAEVQQRWFWSGQKAATKVSIPLFDVRWGKWDEPKVEVSIDGRTKEFLELQQHDGSFSKRPPVLIRYVDELASISDDEFRNYTPLQKSNLVARFAMNWPVLRPWPRHLAYRYVALAALLAEANFNAERLNLPIRRPILESQLTPKSILDPVLYRYSGGRIDAGGYAFCERDRSPGRIISQMDPYREKPGETPLLHSKAIITTNEACQLAAAWLRSIDVDVTELEKANKIQAQQQVWTSGDGAEFLTPLFDVRWGRWEDPKVIVIVDGRGKKLIHLKQNDLSFSKRPPELIRNRDELLAIPDEEFERYSADQKSNLVVRFAPNVAVSGSSTYGPAIPR